MERVELTQLVKFAPAKDKPNASPSKATKFDADCLANIVDCGFTRLTILLNNWYIDWNMVDKTDLMFAVACAKLHALPDKNRLSDGCDVEARSTDRSSNEVGTKDMVEKEWLAGSGGVW